MESESQNSLSSDLVGAVVKPPSIRVSGSFKSTLSGRLTPRSSPSFKRSPSVRTPVRDSRILTPIPWYRRLLSRRLLPWLIVVALWGYIALLVQSRWAHNDGGGGVNSIGSKSEKDEELRNYLTSEQTLVEAAQGNIVFVRDKTSVESFTAHGTTDSNSLSFGPGKRGNLRRAAESGADAVDHGQIDGAKPDRAASLTDTSQNEKQRAGQNHTSWIFPSVGTVNESVGVLVGPFDDIDNSVLDPTMRRRLKSCDRNGIFAKFVQGKSFVLLLHELSMTGSPLAMMELASEILSCGGKVTAVSLSQKGGLLQELLARGIKVLKSKVSASYRAAAKADLLVAGSAVCASWIDKYLVLNKKGSKRLVWWIMENRREYFDRSKHLLGMAKVLIFLSDSQLKQWQSWSQLEGIVLPEMIKTVPLSVNDELAERAGLLGSNGSSDHMSKQLRDLVRAKMGLTANDVLLTTLSSINPGKGQLKLLQAAAMVVDGFQGSLIGGPLKNESHILEGTEQLQIQKGSEFESGSLKLLIGSVGSKSNKVDYIKKLLDYISDNPRLAKVVMWTPATVHVAALYAASDAYVMNSQGLGETFGRVTVEAMAFALPILGTDAGGTSEIVENSVNGMLHPIGSDGVSVLSQHINMILKNATSAKYMGLRGRDHVKLMYLKGIMYEKIAWIFMCCLKECLTKHE